MTQDAEYVSETVLINRLYHRELLARIREIEELEKKWNCKIEFPSTELASDVVTISGPEYQVPQAVDAFLVSCKQSHNELDLALKRNVREWSRKDMNFPFKAPQNFGSFSSLLISSMTSIQNSRSSTKWTLPWTLVLISQ
jgi:hypothetical protein